MHRVLRNQINNWRVLKDFFRNRCVSNIAHTIIRNSDYFFFFLFFSLNCVTSQFNLNEHGFKLRFWLFLQLHCDRNCGCINCIFLQLSASFVNCKVNQDWNSCLKPWGTVIRCSSQELLLLTDERLLCVFIFQT